MNEAVGIIEMFGFVTAITAADAAAKAAELLRATVGMVNLVLLQHL